MTKCKYCDLSALRNESDVEQFLVIRLLKDLNYDDSKIFTKDKLEELKIGKGNKSKLYRPDYVIYLDDEKTKPVIVIDAKSPDEKTEKGVTDAQLYTSVLRRSLKNQKPQQYCIGINGNKLLVKHYESNDNLFDLNFEEINDNNQKFKQLKTLLTYENQRNSYFSSISSDEEIILKRLHRKELNGIFRTCHNIIWKKEKKKPTQAFYEFSKLFFVKLYYDREISRQLKKEGRPIKKEDKEIRISKNKVVFRVEWIEQQKAMTNVENPITNLFESIRDRLEEDVLNGKKKRIFGKTESLSLSYSTTKYVVELLENLYLFGIDEELNGRMFENFLSATVRGKALGQFFTPRMVVKFMTKLADLKVTNNSHIDVVLDGFCGSGGFLVEAMADMFKKVEKMLLTNIQKKKLGEKIVGNYLWGIDADKDPLIPVSKIARMNMYLHGDGSNRIYWLPDTLDKHVEIEETEPELKKQAMELKDLFSDKFDDEGKLIRPALKFNVVLTNPPFSMKYEKKKEDEKRILNQYEIAKQEGKLVSSLNSNILSLERYYGLLRPYGKLITIIDESVLNTKTAGIYRKYIKNHFIIRAIISLPRNTFVNADTGVKTSILYLIKKEKDNETQPPIFMARSDNIGHTDSGKEELERLDLFKEYDENGSLINKDIKKTIFEAYMDFLKNG